MTRNVCRSSAELRQVSSCGAEPSRTFGRILRPNFGICRTSAHLYFEHPRIFPTENFPGHLPGTISSGHFPQMPDEHHSPWLFTTNVRYDMMMTTTMMIMNSVAVSIVDVYKSPPATTLQNYAEPKPDPSQMTLYTAEPPCKRVMLENGDVERAVVAPPRKRVRRSSSSSPRDRIRLKAEDGVSPSADLVCAAAVLTTPASTAPTLRLTQALPLSDRIIGTVWQPVQSQSTTAIISTSSGIFYHFLCICCQQCGRGITFSGRLSVCPSVNIYFA